MIKFSAGYINVNPNFVIQNIEENNENCEPVFAILKNIFQRGCPTIPSRLLKKKFGEPRLFKDYTYYYNFSNTIWTNIIKGGNSSKPALDFYNNHLVNALGKAEAGSFIPECSIINILPYFENNINIDEQVDFYSPLFNAVIEIDGSQHNIDSEQVRKDKLRDNLFFQNGIKIIRITTEELKNSTIVENKLKQLKKNNKYSNSLQDYQKIDVLDIKYLVAIRMELLLLNLFSNKMLSIKDENVIINIFSREKVDKETYNAIAEDFLTWLSHLCKLQNINFTIPSVEINIVESEDLLTEMKGINVDISLTDVYSQVKYDNVYYIRNDYFQYEKDLIPSKKQFDSLSSYLWNKNYYRVAYSEIKYNLSKEKHSEDLEFILKNVSNIYTEFKANQLDIIIECLNNRSVIGILPTGAGKSLCYQLASLLIPSMTLMIAPLQLLMLDQYNSIKEKFGILNATYINSSKYENLSVFTDAKSLITIVSPERFFSEKFTKALTNTKKDLHIGFVVIDEVHCLSEWGHDFRTSYLCLSHNLGRFLPKETFLMGLTGTASHRVFEDIDCEFQNFKQVKTNAIFADNMRRDNLSIIVQKTNDIYNDVLNNIASTLTGIDKNKTLVFTKKRNMFRLDTESACISLVEKIKKEQNEKINETMLAYYSGGDELSSDNKEQILKEFKCGKKLVVFATKAFGMGVDIPDIRKTIHYGLPSSFESLYQEFGRAGRDGKDSRCYVYYKQEPKELVKNFFKPGITIKYISEESFKLDELQTNFYFIQSVNLDPEIEEKIITRIYEGIKTRNSLNKDYVSCKTINEIVLKKLDDDQLNKLLKNPDAIKTIIERSLYRLYLLGEIEMWTLVYGTYLNNPTFNHLITTNLSEIDKLQKLKTHIEKYETHFKFDEQNTFQSRLKFLIKWANDNYLQERIQTMKTLYEQCEEFSSSNIFMTYISNYFSNDPIYVRLIDRSAKIDDWINALKSPPEKTKARIARLLESYDKITALNYVSGITRLMLDDFEDVDGKRRLELAIADISLYSNEDKEFLFNKTYSLLSEKNQEIFIKCWITYCKQDAKNIYKKTQSIICENYIIADFLNELIKVGEKINDKL